MIGCSIPNISVIAVFTICLLSGSVGCSSVDDFEKARSAHAAADAHGDDSVFCLAATSLDQRVADQPRSGHAVGMADRDRSAVDVQFFRVDAELVAAVDDLDGECFVQLPEIDVADLESMTLEQPGHGVD